MHNKTKIWLITAFSFVFIGGIIFGSVMTTLNFDLTKLSTAKYETNDYEIVEDFKNISLVTDTADILFVPSENSKATVVCYEQKNMKHLVTVHNSTLTVELVDTRKWYEYIGINFTTPRITVYLPQGEYGILSVKTDTGDTEIPKDFKFESIDISETTGDVKNFASASDAIKIKTSTGNINSESISANTLDLSVSTGGIDVSKVICEGDINISVSTGKTKLADVKCNNLITSGSTGGILLNNVIATDKLSVVRSTGDVKLEQCDAGELFIETDTGDVKGTLLTSKVFIVQTDTGKVNVPKTITGGKCEINTDTGNIKISISE